MLGVAQHELKRVLARRKFDPGFGLARPEMQMRLVLRDRFVRIDGLIHVDQKMMMAAVRVGVARVRYAHVAQTKAAPERTLDDGAVLRPHEIETRVLRGGLSLSAGGERQASERY